MNQLYLSKKFKLLSGQALVVREKEQDRYDCQKIDFHVKNDDYFGTLATILDLMGQEKTNPKNRYADIMKKLKQNLLYLQKNYKIVKKNNGKEK